MENLLDRVISAPINEFCVISGLGRSSVYKMLDGGQLESIKVGKRRLVLIDSYRRLIDAQRAAAAAPAAAE